MWYDTRKQIGNQGLITERIEFNRDGLQYAPDAFYYTDLKPIDIFPAVDISLPITPKQEYEITYVATINGTGDGYNIAYDISDIPVGTIDSARIKSMISEGQAVTIEDDVRISVAAQPIIVDRTAHDLWLRQLYDSEIISKPPADERQYIKIDYEDVDPFTFTRYEDQWGWRWQLKLTKAFTTNLALYIQDADGNYLYTTGALVDNLDGTWGAVCPAGEADVVPTDVFFKWILGSSAISRNFVYAGNETSLSDVIRSDEDFD